MIAIEELEGAGRIARRDVVGDGYRQHRYEPNEPVDLGVFTPTEVDVLSQVARRWDAHTT